jgi:hypothetical protein
MKNHFILLNKSRGNSCAMQNHFELDTGTKAGTIGGTLLTIVCNIHLEDLTRTAVLAAVGAGVSFTISVFLKWIISKLKKK